ncbi:MAG TPA: MATE family efflux transporter, partial [bacterium]|nr:MATE family efflux transporter [bacterium]
MPPQTLRQSYASILRIAWPLMLTSASYTLMQFTDRVFLSWHDPVSIAASGPAGILNFTFATVFLGTVQFVSTLVAQHFGAKQPAACGRSAWQGIWLALASYPLFLCCVPLGFWLLAHSGHDPAVVVAEHEFYGILTVGALFLLLHNALAGFFSGLGHTRIV